MATVINGRVLIYIYGSLKRVEANKYEMTTHLRFWTYVRSVVHIRGQIGSPDK